MVSLKEFPYVENMLRMYVSSAKSIGLVKCSYDCSTCFLFSSLRCSAFVSSIICFNPRRFHTHVDGNLVYSLAFDMLDFGVIAIGRCGAFGHTSSRLI